MNHRKYDASLNPDDIRQVRAEQIELCREIFEMWMENNKPEIGPDGFLTNADYKAARVYVANEAGYLLGHPVTTGAVKHWFPRWGFYHTEGQKQKMLGFRGADPDD